MVVERGGGGTRIDQEVNVRDYFFGRPGLRRSRRGSRASRRMSQSRPAFSAWSSPPRISCRIRAVVTPSSEAACSVVR